MDVASVAFGMLVGSGATATVAAYLVIHWAFNESARRGGEGVLGVRADPEYALKAATRDVLTAKRHLAEAEGRVEAVSCRTGRG